MLYLILLSSTSTVYYSWLWLYIMIIIYYIYYDYMLYKLEIYITNIQNYDYFHLKKTDAHVMMQ